MTFEECFHESGIILTEAAIAERLKSEFGLATDPAINHAGLIYSHPEIVESIYRQYIETGIRHQLPILLMTPTRRVNHLSIPNSLFGSRPIIHDSCTLLNRIRESYPGHRSDIYIGGLLGCKGDAYSGKKVLDRETAYRFHQLQVAQFAREKVDFLFAGIMPEPDEALGLARAMAESQLPYIISFMIRNNGCLLDGTPLADAIQVIDSNTSHTPVCYMVNCIHPVHVVDALTHPVNRGKPAIGRLRGIQANASRLSPEELNTSTSLHQESFSNMIESMVYLKNHHNFTIFGGCCGTDHRFLDMLAAGLITDSSGIKTSPNQEK